MKGIPKVFLKLLRLVGFLVGSLFIGFLSWQVIVGWFGGTGPANLGSIEVSYVSMGRFLVDFGWKSWAPFWYLGFPFHLFYTPLLPVLEAFLNQRFGMHLWEAYRFVTGWAYILAPVSVFFFGWVLTRRWVGGLVSGVLFSVAPTLFYFILPATGGLGLGEIAADRISFDFWEPRRFTVLVRWGEGPHTLSMVWLPLVGAFFVLALRKKSFLYLVLSSFFLMMTGLSNALGLMGAAVLVASIAFVWHARKKKDRRKVVSYFVGWLLVGLGFSSFWYNLSFLTNFFAEGGGAASIYLSLFPWGWVAILVGIVVLYFACMKLFRNIGFASALVWFSGLFMVVYFYYVSAPQALSERRIELLPQALRYVTQVDMAFSVLVGAAVAWVLRVVGKRLKLAEVILSVFLVTGMLGSVTYIRPFGNDSFDAASNVVDVSNSREKVIADWLESNVDVARGERVFIPGNYGFYLNWFTDVWQHRGALFQAATHFWPEHIHYQMANGEDEIISNLWLKAINAKYMIVSGPLELYNEIKEIDRFSDMSIVFNDTGDLIYKVPLKNDSTAKVVERVKMEKLVAPVKADDLDNLRSYVGWVEENSESKISFKMEDHDNYKISGNLEEGQAILVQMTADPGWEAVSYSGSPFDGVQERQGSSRKVGTGRDPLGFLVLYPDQGDFEIYLQHKSTWRQWLGFVTIFVTVVGVLVFGVRRLVKPKKESEGLETGNKLVNK